MRAINQLTVTRVQGLKEKGRYADGAGLYLYVAVGGSKSWVYRWKKDGKRRETGLGGFPTVGLAKARERAAKARELVLDGSDPIADKRRSSIPTFAQCVDRFLSVMESQWKNDKHRKQWRMTLTDYCVAISDVEVSAIETEDVLQVLNPIWRTKPETASRLRGRIERVLDYATVNNWREGPNPAVWRGHLKSVLPPRAILSRGHHAAIDYKKLPELFGNLDHQLGTAAKALQFLILTATRTGEVLGATSDEIELEQGIWTIPASRMKAGKAYRVPLPPNARDIVSDLMDENTDYLFAGAKPGRPLSNMAMAELLKRINYKGITVHGMRSAFRDWVGEETDYPREIAEAALAHQVGDATERAYRRKDGLERRRKLMEDWERFLNSHVHLS